MIYTVELEWPEIITACNVGVMRHIHAIRSKRKNNNPERGEWERDLNGAIGELATAKYYGLYWGGTVGRVDLPDVGELQVKTIRQPDHRLVIEPGRKNDEAFVLVLMDLRQLPLPLFSLCGWAWGGECKLEEWRGTDGNFYLPNEQLRPMETLQIDQIGGVLCIPAPLRAA